MGFFDIDYPAFVERSMPVRLRKDAHKSWLNALLAPLRELYALFTAFRAANLYRLAHNGQVCKLEAVLNDAFDNTLRRIYITDGDYIDPLAIYLKIEENDVPLALDSELPVTDYDAPLYLYTAAEEAIMSFLFIVHIPVGITGAGYDEVRLRALVDKYRLPSRKYYDVETF
jgi:hypothetical protein